MKILHSIRSVNPEQGGPIEGVKQVSRIHREDGHDVEIVSLDSPDAPWVKDCPLKVHALGPVAGNYGFTHGLVPWLRGRASGYDTVIVQGLWQYHSLGVWRALRGSPMPYYVFPHGMLDPWFKRTYPLKHLKKWLYWPWAEYRVLRDARAVCFTCEEERRLARQSFRLYQCAEQVLNYGTSAPPDNPDGMKELFFRKYPHLRDKRIILFLGRLHEKKGCDLLLKAFHKLISGNSDFAADSTRAHLVIAGPDQTGWLRKLKALAASLGIKDRVTWPGMLTGDLKTGALWTAEIFALPSHQENFGIAVVEALACGVPALISNKVNIWREIEQDQAGLVENDDEAGAFNLLRRWFSLSADQRREYRAQARCCFASRFEIRRAARSLTALLERGKELNGHRI
jgi:glycosyltransferase involved in cell wall biosynthesis